MTIKTWLGLTWRSQKQVLLLRCMQNVEVCLKLNKSLLYIRQARSLIEWTTLISGYARNGETI